MKILVDTSDLSLALCRKDPGETVTELKDIILSSMAVIIGPVRLGIIIRNTRRKHVQSFKSKFISIYRFTNSNNRL